MDLQEISRDESVSCCYGSTLAKDSSFNMPCSWAAADPSSFLIRGDNYLVDNQKVVTFTSIILLVCLVVLKVRNLFNFNVQVKAKSTLLQMVAADWLRSDKREDDLAGRYGGIVQV